jgi:hypothetical protein
MIEYLLLMSLAIILFFNPNSGKKKILNIVFICLAIFLAGFRDMIGGYDVYIYAEVYESILRFDNSNLSFEPFFIIYYEILNFINGDRHFMFFITSLIILGSYFYFIKKLSVWFYFSLYIFFCKFYLIFFVYLRQGMAISFVLFSFYFLLKHKKIKAVLLAITAILFHKSAFIFLPFIFVANLKLSKIGIFFLVVLLCVFSFSPLGEVIFSSVGNSLGQVKYVNYAKSSAVLNFFYVFEGFSLLALISHYKEKFNFNIQYRIIFNGIIVYCLLVILGITNATLIRLSWYYFMFICLGLPIIYFFIHDIKLRKTFKIVIFVYYLFLFFRLLFLFDSGDFMPYKNIFQDFDRNGIWEFREYR